MTTDPAPYPPETPPKPTTPLVRVALGRLVLAVQRRWDWWIYCRAVHSLRRMTIQNPGMSYLMELQIRGWNEQLNISPELRRSTEVFHAAMNDHRQNH